MQDSAKGAISGFIFQFEKALLMLSELKNLNDAVSIEQVDDVATINKNSVLIAVQAKHSISPHGSTFQDTSYALWRTLQIWVRKIEKGVFNDKTTFICCTNKEIKEDSLLFKMSQTENFDEILEKIIQIKKDQEKKLSDFKQSDPKKGSSIESVLKIIRSVLRKKKQLETVVLNLQIKNESDIKQEFLNTLRVGIDSYSEQQKNKIYHEFHGWIFNRSIAKWRNNSEAIFKKEEFDTKHFQVFSNPSITNLIFRTKKDLQNLYKIEGGVFSNLQTELFVKQLDDIDRNPRAKERIIKKAIINFFYYDIELSHLIKEGNFTKPDFDDFIEQCEDLWQDIFDRICIKAPTQYTDEEKNIIAANIFDESMSDLRSRFKDYVSFNQSNDYFKKGCLLKLSNIPQIGWHPDWEDKYKKNNGSK